MQIIVDKFGMFLGKKGSRFVLDAKEDKKEIAADI